VHRHDDRRTARHDERVLVLRGETAVVADERPRVVETGIFRKRGAGDEKNVSLAAISFKALFDGGRP